MSLHSGQHMCHLPWTGGLMTSAFTHLLRHLLSSVPNWQLHIKMCCLFVGLSRSLSAHKEKSGYFSCQPLWTYPLLTSVYDYQWQHYQIFLLYSRGGAPSFTQKPAIRQVDGGKRILFECKVAADPIPVLTWFREDVQLSNGGELPGDFVFLTIGISSTTGVQNVV